MPNSTREINTRRVEREEVHRLSYLFRGIAQMSVVLLAWPWFVDANMHARDQVIPVLGLL